MKIAIIICLIAAGIGAAPLEGTIGTLRRSCRGQTLHLGDTDNRRGHPSI